jgi:SOS response regulatory protein OraA/RecX
VDAYTLALTWLARRELTERQVRAGLTKREFGAGEIDEAVARLRKDGALDDRRVAGAYVRTAVRLKGRGPVRLRRDLEALGIDSAAAHEAVDEVLADVSEETLIERALERRWPRSGPPDRATAARIHRALLRQGFTAEKVMSALRRRGHPLEE